MLTISLFGQLVDIVGRSEIELEAVANVEQLKAQLLAVYPALEQTTFLIAVDKTVANDATPLSAQCEIALLPPFSGG
jgi:sulfur-carrier protein